MRRSGLQTKNRIKLCEKVYNYYANQGQPASHIVSPLYIASGYVSLVLKSPASGTTLRSRFMRSDESYNHVFAESAPLKVWPVIARILKKTDAVLATVRPVGTGANERFLKNWRQVTAFLATTRAFGRFTFSAAELADFKPDALSNDLLASTWEFVKSHAGSQLNWQHRKGRGFFIKVCREAAALYSLSGVDTVERFGSSGTKHSQPLPSDFVERVQAALLAQPWKPGVHRDVARQLGCRSDDVYAVIQQLIASGRRNVQKDGVVYASDGSVLARDDERVSTSETQAPG